jgi:hypothetical protein
MKGLMTVAGAFALAACSSSALMVERPPAVPTRVESATLEYETPTIAVEEGTQQHLQRRMAEALTTGKDAVFKPGGDMVIKYRFVGHNEGSRLGRYLTMGMAGGSKTYILADFINPAGEMIGQVRAEGSVGVGIAGGSAKSGVDGAVKKIAAYAQATFRR